VLKKTIKYVDFDGQNHVEDFYFHLSKLELMQMELGMEGGFEKYISKVLKDDKKDVIVATVMELVSRSYGRKSEDGKSFVKSESIRQAFEGSPAFEQMVLELITDESGAEAWWRGVVPADLENQVPVTTAVSVDKIAAEDPADLKPWVTENREPTKAELKTMSHEDLQQVYLRKTGN
jgi:hypothetical protein